MTSPPKKPVPKKPSFDPDILTFGHLLPHDPDAERRLLGSLLTAPVNISDVRVPLGEGEVFYSAEHLNIYQSMLAIYDRGEVVSYFTVQTDLRRNGLESVIRDADMTELIQYGESLTTLRNVAFYLREMMIQRHLFLEGGKLLASIRDRQPFGDQIAMLHQINDYTSAKMTLANQRNTSYYARKMLMDIETASRKKDGLTGITTGSRKLDKLTGGWQPEQLYYVGGRPGGGKTALLMSAFKAAGADGVPSCFKSVEMSPTQMIQRLVSSECGIPYQDLGKGRHENGTPFSPEEWQAINQATGYIESLPLYFYDGPAHDINDFVRWVKDKIQRNGVKIAFLDYVQSMTDEQFPRADKVQIVAGVSQKLKGMTTQLHMPIVAAAQLGRQVDERKNRRPLLADFKESGQIEQDADMALAIYRDDYYKLQDAKAKSKDGRFDEPIYDNETEVDAVKNRHGGLGRVRLGTNIGCNIFSDVVSVGTKPMPPRFQTEKAPDAKWINKFPDGAARDFSQSDRETLGSFDRFNLGNGDEEDAEKKTAF